MKSKKRLLGILLIMAMVIVSIFAITACDQEPAPTPGSEEGTYVSIGGEHSIMLHAGPTGTRFALSFSGESVMAGYYTLNQTTLTLEFDADDAPNATATLQNEEINLTAFNRTTRFLKRVQRTVTFDSRQGSTVPSVQVLNGQVVPVGQTRVPTRAGHDFVGWFLDAEGNNSFEFGVNVIERNTTVYAYWRESVDPNYIGFAIDFDWGIDGQANPIGTQTINGRLYNMPQTITRAGYTFGGWWVSMVEDANALTYQAAVRSTVFVEDTTLHALWIPAGAAVAAPLVQVTRDGAISWNSVAGASIYRLSIINPHGIRVVNNISIPGATTSFTHNFSNLGNYTIEVVTEGVGGAASAAAVRGFRHRALPRVSNFNVVNSVLTFNQVPNAVRYFVSVQFGTGGQTFNNIPLGNSNRLPFDDARMAQGGITFTVEAAAPGFASSIATFVYDKELGTITQINIDTVTQTASWNAIASAQNYVVSIRRGSDTLTIDNGSRTSISLREFAQGDMQISVRPEAIGYNSPAGEPVWTPFNKATVATPSNVRLDGNTIRWTAVAGATGYTINIGSQEIEVAGANSNHRELTSVEIAALRATIGDYTLSIRANASNASLFSYPVVVSNSVPNFIDYAQGYVLWNHVLGASRYVIIINEGTGAQRIYDVSAGTAAKRIALSRAGENIVSFYAYDLNNRRFSPFSVDVNVFAYTVTFDVGGHGLLADADRFRFVATGDPIAFPDVTVARVGHDLDTWNTTPGAVGHNTRRFLDRYFTGGDLVLFANWAPHRFNINLESGLGSVVSDDTEVVFGQINNIEVPSINGNGFIGWFTAPGGFVGGGTRLTDERGIMIAPWNLVDADGINLYAFYGEVFRFSPTVNGFMVSRGADIGSVRHLVVPDYYNDLPVNRVGMLTNVLLESITLGRNIDADGVDANAFDGCSNLTNIHVHSQNPNFASVNGVLFNSDGTTLVRYPTGRSGRFIIPETVTIIGPWAFRDNFHLEAVEIPGTVNYIMAEAFNNNANLRTIILHQGIQRIENRAFSGLPALNELIIPADLRFLGAMIAMTNLDTIIFSGGSSVDLTLGGLRVDDEFSIPDGVFEGAFRLRYVIFEEGSRVVNIPDAAFRSNSRMYEINIPASVRYIGVSAFEEVRFLERVNIADNSNLERIGGNAFLNTFSLTEVYFEGSANIETIAGAANPAAQNFSVFANHPALETIVLPSGLISVGIRAFENIPNLKVLTFRNSPNFTTIGAGAFNGLVNLTHLTLPATTDVGNITSGMFVDSTVLEVIAVTSDAGGNFVVGQNALFTVGAVTLVLLPGNREAINFELPNTTANICDHALITITNLETFTVATGNTAFSAVDGVLFSGTTLVRFPSARQITGDTYTVPANIAIIGIHAFRGNRYLEEINFASGSQLVTIGAHSFRETEVLFTVDLAGVNLLYTIGAYAFADSVNIDGLSVPQSVREIGANAFRGVTLSEFEFGFGMESIPDFALANNLIETIRIPYTVTHIGEAAFLNAINASSIVFFGRPGGAQTGDPTSPQLTHIGARAFENTALTSINIPQGVQEIGAGAFRNINSADITEIYIPGTVTILGDSAFENVGVEQVGSISPRIDITFGAVPSGSDAQLTMGTAVFANVNVNSVAFETGSNVINIGARAFDSQMINRAAAFFNATNSPVLEDLNWSIHIPNTVEYIGEFAFRGTARAVAPNRTVGDFNSHSTFADLATRRMPFGLIEVTFEGGNLVPGAPGASRVSEFRQGAFQGSGVGAWRGHGSDDITFVFPNSLVHIRDLAFAGFGATVALAGGVSAFGGRVVFNDNLETIGHRAFDRANGINAIILNYGLRTIGNDAFNQASIQGRYTMGHVYAFENILTDPNHALYAANRAFFGDDDAVNSPIRTGILTDRPQYIYDNGVNTGRIDPNTINDWDLVIPDTVTYIGVRAFNQAFSGLTSLSHTAGSPGFNGHLINVPAGQLPTIGTGSGDPPAFTRRVQRIFIGQNSQLQVVNEGAFNSSQFVGNHTLYLPESLHTLGTAVFGGATFQHSRGTLVIDPRNLTNFETAVGFSNNLMGPFTLSGFEYLEIAAGTTEIPAGLFGGNRFREITIANTVQTIGTQAFQQQGASGIAPSIRSLIFEEGSSLTHIGQGAFNWLQMERQIEKIYNLPSFIAPQDVFNIFGGRVGAFDTTYNVLPTGARRAVDGVLFSNDGTTLEIFPSGRSGAYTIPNTVVGTTPVTAIAPFAFAGGRDPFNAAGAVFHQSTWPLIQEITLPNSIQSIGISAFRNARNLTAVHLDREDSQLNHIGAEAFINARALNTFTIPDGLTAQGLSASALVDTHALTNVNLWGEHPHFVIEGPFLLNRANQQIITVVGVGEYIRIADGTTTIAAGQFANRVGFQRLYLPASVTSIGAGAFDGVTTLTQIIFEGGESQLRIIGNNAFRNTNIANLHIPASVEEIGHNAFEFTSMGNSALTRVTFGDNSLLAVIGDSAFRGNRNLAEFNFPNRLQAIGNYSFNLTALSGHLFFPASLETIGMSAFSGLSNVTDITFADNSRMLSIGIWAFVNIAGLQSINFGANSSLEAIHTQAFMTSNTMAGFTYINLPDNLITLGPNVFRGRFALQAVNVSENAVNFASVDGVLFNRAMTEIVLFPQGKRTTTYIIPDSVRVIRSYAFDVSPFVPSGLNNLILHNGVTTIETHAIGAGGTAGNQFNVNIPFSVRTMGTNAFTAGSTGLNPNIFANVQGRTEDQAPWENWQNGAWVVRWNQPVNVEVDVFHTAGANGNIRANANTAGGALIEWGNSTLASTVVFTALPNIGFEVASWTLNGEIVDDNETSTLVFVVQDRLPITVHVEFRPIAAEYMARVDFNIVGTNGLLRASSNGHNLTTGMSINRGWTLEFAVSGLAANFGTRWYVDDVFMGTNNEFNYVLTDDVEIRAVPTHLLITTQVIGTFNLSNRFAHANQAGTFFVTVWPEASADYIPEAGRTVSTAAPANSRTLAANDWIRFQAQAPGNNANFRLRWTVNGEEIIHRAGSVAFINGPADVLRVGTHGNTNNELFVRLDGRLHVTVEQVPNTVDFEVIGTGGTILPARIGNNPNAGIIVNNGGIFLIANHANNQAGGRLNFTAVPEDGYRVSHWYVNGERVVQTNETIPNTAPIAANNGRWINTIGNPNVLIRMPQTAGPISVAVVFEPIPVED
ncbi:MAG: leucine-rich repeat protein [Firmicutes bacterium]|nr:leucine-rich repeat protein [Bacillota bacterium]